MNIIIVGGGPAGMSAAIPLAKNDIDVTVLEAGPFCGAENWSGAVYFTENLTDPELLGDAIHRDAPWERNLVKRAVLSHNGSSLVGYEYQNRDSFQDCYTVLRPKFDRWLAEKAREFGATVHTETAAKSLIYHDGEVIGAHTNRGPVYGDCVFLAEGDAAELTTNEDYEILSSNTNPTYIQGIKELIDVDRDQLERTFGLERPADGAAWDIFLEHDSLDARGYIYTNEESVSLGIMTPLQDPGTSVADSPTELMEWFKELPEIQRIIESGSSVGYGSKLIRAGGTAQSPRMADHGLAIGGAATGIGSTVPYPNFIGPATAMGTLFAQAVMHTHRHNEILDRKTLKRRYVNVVQSTHHFDNTQAQPSDFQIHFPKLGAINHLLDILSDPDIGSLQKFWQLNDVLRNINLNDFFDGVRAIRFPIPDLRSMQVTDPIQWVKNTFSDNSIEDQGTLEFIHHTSLTNRKYPKWILNFRRTLKPALSKAFGSLYRNDEKTVSEKLSTARRTLNESIDLALVFRVCWMLTQFALLRPVISVVNAGYRLFFGQIDKSTSTKSTRNESTQTEHSLIETRNTASQSTSHNSHLKVFSPHILNTDYTRSDMALIHVCPSGVFERNDNTNLIVNPKNCVKCDACWQITGDVNYTRLSNHRITYPSSIGPEETRPVNELEALDTTLNPPAFTPVSLDDNNISTAVRAQLKSFESQLRRLRNSLDDTPNQLTPDAVRWRKTLGRFLRSTLNSIRSLDDHNVLRSFISNVESTIDRIQNHLARRNLYQAQALAGQLIEHHIASIDRTVGIADHYESQYQSYSTRENELTVSTDHKEHVRERLHRIFSSSRLRAMRNGDSLTVEELDEIGNDIEPQRSDQLKRAHLEEVGRVDPGLGFIVAQQYTSCELIHTVDPDGTDSSKSPLPYPAIAWHAGSDESHEFVIPLGTDQVLSVVDSKIRLNNHTVTDTKTTVEAGRIKPVQIEIGETLARQSVNFDNKETWLVSMLSEYLNPVLLGTVHRLMEHRINHFQTKTTQTRNSEATNSNAQDSQYDQVHQQIPETLLARYLLNTLVNFPANEMFNSEFDGTAVMNYLLGVEAFATANKFTWTSKIRSDDQEFVQSCANDALILNQYPFDTDSLYQQIGAKSLNHDWVKSVLRLSKQEQSLWQTADEFGVLDDPVRHWRTLIGDYGSFGSHEDESILAYRGRHLTHLWAGRQLVNRTQARLMTGYDARREVELTKLWLKKTHEFKRSAESIVEYHQERVQCGQSVSDLTSTKSAPIESKSVESNSSDYTSGQFLFEMDSRTLPISTNGIPEDCPEEYSQRTIGESKLTTSTISDRIDFSIHVTQEIAKLHQLSRKHAKTKTDYLRLSEIASEFFSIESICLNLCFFRERDWIHSIRSESLLGTILVERGLRHSLQLAREIIGPDLIKKRDTLKQVQRLESSLRNRSWETEKMYILKQLASKLAPKMNEYKRVEFGDERLEELYDTLHERVTACIDEFGETVWTVPEAGSVFFKVVDIVAAFYRLECTLSRTKLITHESKTLDELNSISNFIYQSACREIELRDELLEHELDSLRDEINPPELQITQSVLKKSRFCEENSRTDQFVN